MLRGFLFHRIHHWLLSVFDNPPVFWRWFILKRCGSETSKEDNFLIKTRDKSFETESFVLKWTAPQSWAANRRGTSAPWHKFNEHTILSSFLLLLLLLWDVFGIADCRSSPRCSSTVTGPTGRDASALSPCAAFNRQLAVACFLSQKHAKRNLNMMDNKVSPCFVDLFSSRHSKPPCKVTRFSRRQLFHLQRPNAAGLLRVHERRNAAKSWRHVGRFFFFFCQLPYWNELERNVLILFLDGNDTSRLCF